MGLKSHLHDRACKEVKKGAPFNPTTTFKPVRDAMQRPPPLRIIEEDCKKCTSTGLGGHVSEEKTEEKRDRAQTTCT